MSNRSTSFSMLRNDPTEDYEEPPDSMRRDTYIPGDYSDDSFENDDEQQEKSEMPKATPKCCYPPRHWGVLQTIR